jgi:hypothetical protein
MNKEEKKENDASDDIVAFLIIITLSNKMKLKSIC